MFVLHCCSCLKYLCFHYLDEGKIYKIVQWKDLDGRMRSELIDVLEGTYPEAIRVMELSAEVNITSLVIFYYSSL